MKGKKREHLFLGGEIRVIVYTEAQMDVLYQNLSKQEVIIISLILLSTRIRILLKTKIYNSSAKHNYTG